MFEYLHTLLREKEVASAIFKRNLVREYLQVLILSFLYSHKEYQSIVFYGGSSLRHCYHLPRLSEDLDFVDIGKKISLDHLAEELKEFFSRKHDLKIRAKVQKFRCTLKFPMLHRLGLSNLEESDDLFSKIEIYREFEFCKGYEIEIKPVFKFGEALLVKTFDLPTLMATKIRAIMHRKWERTAKDGRILAEVKGRDYYDLMWYLEQGIRPNMRCIENIINEKELYTELIEMVKRLNVRSIKYDLEGLIEDPRFVDTLKDNIKDILISLLSKRLVS